MIPDLSKTLVELKKYPGTLKGICRGIERETLRVKQDGSLTDTSHPTSLGSALTHQWITTDFAEALLELVTPRDDIDDINYLVRFLSDLHRYVAQELTQERMWPFSMPCIINDPNKIKLAEYGKSNIGRMKTLYRRGLKNRYGAMMQIIAGVHYNFSLPIAFWQKSLGKTNITTEDISSGYLTLIRNYYRFGWIIPYLFGASPAMHSSFLEGRKTNLCFETDGKEILWLPYATSLRLSNVGYNNKKNVLDFTYNSLEEYVDTLNNAINTPSDDYLKIGIRDKNNHLLQLNANVLQTENELYVPVRPKRFSNSANPGRDLLLQKGIEYIEIRSLDINPFSTIGINYDQIRFLDLFLIWCSLTNQSKMTKEELHSNRKNWNKISLEGRKPNLEIDLNGGKDKCTLLEIGKRIFNDLYYLAKILDTNEGDMQYQNVCNKFIKFFENPELTYSARILHRIKTEGFLTTAMMLAENHYSLLKNESLEILSQQDFLRQLKESIESQHKIEKNDCMEFERYLDSLYY
ncbi:glutamate--cysteine ligase [Candidatus Ishikawella capsulata]|uniref:glutamate--cysteine ligase n=1 Tax=Candidatus Ishikawella capsulata TaxID=168169 RepID=UPI000693E684|nr:glutamate--cysteine ligase [Candidatus Ishikawaella capsulata]